MSPPFDPVSIQLASDDITVRCLRQPGGDISVVALDAELAPERFGTFDNLLETIWAS